MEGVEQKRLSHGKRYRAIIDNVGKAPQEFWWRTEKENQL